MDFNELYQRHQVALVMAYRARSERSRRDHQDLANAYARMITEAKANRLGEAA